MNKAKGKQTRPVQGEARGKASDSNAVAGWLAGWQLVMPEKSGNIAASPECGASVLLRTSNDFTTGAPARRHCASLSYSAHHPIHLAMLSTAARPAFRAGAAAMRYVRPSHTLRAALLESHRAHHSFNPKTPPTDLPPTARRPSPPLSSLSPPTMPLYVRSRAVSSPSATSRRSPRP